MARSLKANRFKDVLIAATRREVESIIEEGGVLPLRMMVGIAHFYYGRHLQKREQLHKLEADSEDGPLFEEAVTEAAKDLEKDVVLYGKLTVEAAERVLPYFHARLSRVEISGDINSSVQHEITITQDYTNKSQEELARLFSEIAREEPENASQKAALAERAEIVRLAPPQKQKIRRSSDVVVDMKRRG